ncbi:MAG: hypothetical protein ABW202_05385, partial [Duganella sp.]
MNQPHSYLNWSPQIHFPWSGGVAQHIEPDLNWFSHWITPGAGNAGIEEKAFTDVASYGKQLGLITEVLLALAHKNGLPEDGAVAELASIRQRIAMLKSTDATLAHERIVAQVTQIQQRGGAELQTLAAQLLPLL